MGDNKGPTFIGIGAQRAGTTWIAACLAEHPQICVSYPKELCFFNSSSEHIFVNEPKNWNKGVCWYEQQFIHCSHFRAKGEFSVLYMPDKKAVANIYELYPNVRIIASLRNPVQRALSAFAHLKRLSIMYHDFPIDPVPEDIFEASRLVPGIIEFGKYKTQLEPYLRLFGREKVKIVVYEDIALNPVTFMQDIYTFLGVNPTFIPGSARQQRNPDSVPRLKFVERDLTIGSQILCRLGLSAIVKWAKQKGIPDKIRIWNAKSHFTRLTVEQYFTLQKKYEEDIYWVEELLERSLDSWRRIPKELT